jgi:tRNA(adenine34) deaminase
MEKNNDEWYMRKALQQAQYACDNNEVPIGAVVVYGNKIIAMGYNQVELLKDSTAHAEMIALTAAYEALGAKYLVDATMYITVEPCMMCTGALYWSKIGRIVYGASDNKNGISKYFDLDNAALSNQQEWPFHPKTILTKGVLKEECAALMQEFFKSLRQ